jgi:microcystin-dependent protein
VRAIQDARGIAKYLELQVMRKEDRGLLVATIALLAILAFFFNNSARSQFTGSTWGGTSTGSANAQSITLPNVVSLADLTGVKFSFLVGGGLTNTQPATLAVSGLAATNVYRKTPAGAIPLGGGELTAGMVVTLTYDGTQFQCESCGNPQPPGFIMDYGGASCPAAGWAIANGATLSATTYSGLNSVLGTTWGTSGGNIVLPDLRNRATFGQDVNQGGFSNRITAGGGNFDGTVVGNAGGGQNQTLTIAQLPSAAPFSSSGSFSGTSGPSFPQSGWAAQSVQGGGTPIEVTSTAPSTYTPAGSVGLSITLGQGTSHPILAPAAIVSKCVRT